MPMITLASGIEEKSQDGLWACLATDTISWGKQVMRGGQEGVQNASRIPVDILLIYLCQIALFRLLNTSSRRKDFRYFLRWL